MWPLIGRPPFFSVTVIGQLPTLGSCPGAWSTTTIGPDGAVVDVRWLVVRRVAAVEVAAAVCEVALVALVGDVEVALEAGEVMDVVEAGDGADALG